jgi:hypothetical protein
MWTSLGVADVEKLRRCFWCFARIDIPTTCSVVLSYGRFEREGVGSVCRDVMLDISGSIVGASTEHPLSIYFTYDEVVLYSVL